MNSRLTQTLLTAFLLLLIPLIAIPQSKQKPSAPPAGQSSLQGLTEAVLVNNQPSLRILSTKNRSTEISYQKRDGEDALVFPVMHWHAFLYAQGPGEMGEL